MKGHKLSFLVEVFGVLRNEMPPNCEVLMRAYVGDWCFGLIREPHNRALYLASPWGFWKLDTLQLCSTFADEVQLWKRDEEFQHARGLTGRIVPVARWMGAPAASTRKQLAAGKSKVSRRRRAREPR